jgi:FixJ family two-component response regulator
MLGKHPLVSVVDDDESVRESLPDLLSQFGFATEAFPSAEAFLASGTIGETDCLILDIAMPGMSGPELQEELMQRGQKMPIVFITAQGDQMVRQQLVAAGAVECLPQTLQRHGAARCDQGRACGGGNHDEDDRDIGSESYTVRRT